MTARCTRCAIHWNISVYQRIPKEGYVCPYCESRRTSPLMKNEQPERSKSR